MTGGGLQHPSVIGDHHVQVLAQRQGGRHVDGIQGSERRGLQERSRIEQCRVELDQFDVPEESPAACQRLTSERPECSKDLGPGKH